MRRALWHSVLLLLVMVSAAGCALSRKGVVGLGHAQGDYYTALHDTLKAQRGTLDAGLTVELSADRTRQRNMLQWERELERAEVILQQRNPNVTGEQRLLEMKLAELDLAAVDRLSGLQGVDEVRKGTILRLYDKVIQAVDALERNNRIILTYLEGSDAAFFLRSVDIDGIFRLVADIQEVRNELAHSDKRAQEQQQKQGESVRQAVERVRNLLINVYAK